MVRIIGSLLTCAYIVYICCGSMLRDKHRSDLATLLWLLAKWPALASVIWDPAAIIFFEHEVPSTWVWISAGLSGWIWHYFSKAGDDDDTKRLRERITGSVKDIGGRLVVVPARA